jgi:hypothetical protein
LEDLIFTYDLEVCNTGSHCTFFNRRAATIIDVTMASHAIAQHIKEWRVDESVEASDHHLICFKITISIKKYITTRNYDKGNWPLFQSSMEENHTMRFRRAGMSPA